jgi:dipeptidyl-peptidase-4
VQVYGGPHVQTALDSWLCTVELRAQYLAKEGFLVMRVDNRGSARRGLAFEGAIARRMGTVEVNDQVDGVRFAKSEGWVDGDRVGIYGWSYGGYMTLMCLLKAPEVFRAGVAGAPNADMAGYDSHYTERYMGTPSGNPEGYREASCLTFAERLRGRLLMIHGMLDENVHFRHTARFVNALVKANRPYELLLYPEERHMPRSEKDRRNMEERIVEFFKASL